MGKNRERITQNWISWNAMKLAGDLDRHGEWIGVARRENGAWCRPERHRLTDWVASVVLCAASGPIYPCMCSRGFRPVLGVDSRTAPIRRRRVCVLDLVRQPPLFCLPHTGHSNWVSMAGKGDSFPQRIKVLIFRLFIGLLLPFPLPSPSLPLFRRRCYCWLSAW